MGGDEFAVLLVNIDSAPVLESVIARLRVAMTAPIDLADEQTPLAISMGAALWSQANNDQALLFRLADEAMYRDKASRKGMRPPAMAGRGLRAA